MDLTKIPQLKHTDSNNFFLLSGPCAIEGEDMAMRIAEKVVAITDKLNIPYVFKGSFKKANRSRIDSFTGIGDEKALKILQMNLIDFDMASRPSLLPYYYLPQHLYRSSYYNQHVYHSML